MSPKSAEERDGESEENEAEESEESINYSEDSNPNYFTSYGNALGKASIKG